MTMWSGACGIVSLRASLFAALIACGTSYPTETYFSCTDSRTIGISSSSVFMSNLAQSADTSMSLVVTGSVSGTIVSGTGATTGTYEAGETLTVSTLGSTGLHLFHGNIDGLGSCDFATYGFTRAYGSSVNGAADQIVTAPSDGSSISIKSLRAEAYTTGMYVNEATLEASISTPQPTSTPPSGACYHHTSTVTRLGNNGQGTAQVPITEVAEGSRILALDQHSTPFFAKIKALPHGPSAEPFVHIVMNGDGQRELKATLHHTFDTCVHGKNPFMQAARGQHTAVIMAKDIKAGDCLHTAEGKRTVRSITHTAVQKGDETYSIKLENGISTVAVGGVFTHSMGQHSRDKYKRSIYEKEKSQSNNQAHSQRPQNHV